MSAKFFWDGERLTVAGCYFLTWEGVGIAFTGPEDEYTLPTTFTDCTIKRVRPPGLRHNLAMRLLRVKGSKKYYVHSWQSDDPLPIPEGESWRGKSENESVSE
jgi:hypothetical protein